MPEKVLVVDDDPDIAKFIEISLTRAGYEVAVAHDGHEALDLVAAERPDLVLLDIMLPTIDGFEVAAELRRRARLAGMGIIVVTARSMSEDHLRGLALGIDDYIVKPFEPELLVARVRAALRRLREMRSLSPLTGLPGTVLIEEEVRRYLERGRPFALLYADLDHFKVLNDTKGWDVGDRVILAAAGVLEEAVRRLGGPDGFVGHIGGDDFVALVEPEAGEEPCASASTRRSASSTGPRSSSAAPSRRSTGAGRRCGTRSSRSRSASRRPPCAPSPASARWSRSPPR